MLPFATRTHHLLARLCPTASCLNPSRLNQASFCSRKFKFDHETFSEKFSFLRSWKTHQVRNSTTAQFANALQPKSTMFTRHTIATITIAHRPKSSKIERLRETKKQLQETKKVMKERFEGMRENIWTYPNALCMIRIGLTPLLGYYVVQGQFEYAFALFAFAGITDLLDGYIARNFANQSSMLGSFLDPFADKLLVATLFGTLTYANLMPIPLTAIIILRDVGLMSAALYLRYQSLPEPKTLARYFDVTMATAQLSPTLISKVNTAIQICTVGATLGAPVFHYVSHPALEALWYLTAATTALSAISYAVSKNTYKFVKEIKKTSPKP